MRRLYLRAAPSRVLLGRMLLTANVSLVLPVISVRHTLGVCYVNRAPGVHSPPSQALCRVKCAQQVRSRLPARRRANRVQRVISTHREVLRVCHV